MSEPKDEDINEYSNIITDKNNNEYNNNRFNNLLPSIKFVFNNELKQVKINLSQINNKFDMLKSIVDNKINTNCHNEKNTLVNLKLLKEKSMFSKEELESEKLSLFQFIIMQKEKYQNHIDNFTNCVEDQTEEESKFSDFKYNNGEAIIKNIYICNTYMQKRYNYLNKTDEEALAYYQKCLKFWTDKHKKFTSNWIAEADTIISNNNKYL